jgi:hypothetical protein
MANEELYRNVERYITKVNNKFFNWNSKILQLITDLVKKIIDYQHPVSHQPYVGDNERSNGFKVRADIKSIIRVCAAYHPGHGTEALQAIYDTFMRPNSERDFSIPRFVGLARVVLKDGKENQTFDSFNFSRLAEEQLRIKKLFTGKGRAKRQQAKKGRYESARAVARHRPHMDDLEERNW